MHRITNLFALSCIALIGSTVGQAVSHTQENESRATTPCSSQEGPGLLHADLEEMDNDLETTSSGNNCSSYNPLNEFVPQGSDQSLFVLDTNCKGREGRPSYICKGSHGVGVGLKEDADDSWVCNVILPNGTSVEERENITLLREPNSELGITLMWKLKKERRYNAHFINRHRITSPVEIDEGVKVGKCKIVHHPRRRWGHFMSHRRHHNGATDRRGRAVDRQMWRRAKLDENDESTATTLQTTNVPHINFEPQIGLIFGNDNFVTLTNSPATGHSRTCTFYKILVCSNTITRKPLPSARWRRIQASA